MDPRFPPETAWYVKNERAWIPPEPERAGLLAALARLLRS
jgi:hypothetical protein